MLKLQQQGTDKTIWLVGPEVKLGSAGTNDFVVTGTGIIEHHCSLLVANDDITLEVKDGAVVYLNEKQVKGKATVVQGDTLRLVTQEFLIVDPSQKGDVSQAAQKAPISSEATVFRAPPQAEVAPSKGSGWILQALHKSLQNKRYPIEGTMAVGRSPDCELHFSHDRLSRRHAELKIIDGALVVKDLDSSNGTFKNGEKIKQATLQNGDTLSFDKLDFAVVAPVAQSGAGHSENAMNQTVMRPAVSPNAAKAAKKEPVKTEQSVATPNKANNTLGMALVGGAVLVIVALLVVFLL